MATKALKVGTVNIPPRSLWSRLVDRVNFWKDELWGYRYVVPNASRQYESIEPAEKLLYCIFKEFDCSSGIHIGDTTTKFDRYDDLIAAWYSWGHFEPVYHYPISADVCPDCLRRILREEEFMAMPNTRHTA